MPEDERLSKREGVNRVGWVAGFLGDSDSRKGEEVRFPSTVLMKSLMMSFVGQVESW